MGQSVFSYNSFELNILPALSQTVEKYSERVV